MNREKQIQDIATILWHIPNGYNLNSYNDCEVIAECIYDDGDYHKQSKGVWMPSDFLHEEEDEKDDWKNYACSLCGYKTEAYYRDVRDIGYNFCPNCGAKMKGGTV